MKSCLTLVIVLGTAAPAMAQDRTEANGTIATDNMQTTATSNWNDPDLDSGIGVEASLGGGVSGFTDKVMRDSTSSVGGMWNLRVALGTHLPIGFEASYVGTADSLHSADQTMKIGDLLGTSVEGAARINFIPHGIITPYVFAGFGWTHYKIMNANAAALALGQRDSDDISEVPMGVGVAYRNQGLVVEARGTFRVTQDQDLVANNASVQPGSTISSDFAPMHRWDASASVGYEF